MTQPFTNYEIFPALKLIVEYYAGDISLDLLIGTKKEISKNKNYNPNYNLIMDMRDSNFQYARESVNKFTDFFKSFQTIIGKRKVAYLTRNPNEVVATKLFSQQISDLELDTQTFTTVPAIINWVNISGFTEDDFESIVCILKSKA